MGLQVLRCKAVQAGEYLNKEGKAIRAEQGEEFDYHFNVAITTRIQALTAVRNSAWLGFVDEKDAVAAGKLPARKQPLTDTELRKTNEKLNADIAGLNEEIEELQKQLKDAGDASAITEERDGLLGTVETVTGERDGALEKVRELEIQMEALTDPGSGD